ncbi:MAG: DUF5596 domain-containing protein [Lawsonibacter sp.]|nr:DUF5596 domain-containing protein [Lawsonibacter sp.]MCI9156690.1 DUF5596 domain-containing protein [Lawsonibacter sp.]
MDQPELYRRIDLPAAAVEKLEAVAEQLDLTPLEPCLTGLQDRSAAPGAYRRLKALLQEDKDHFQLLYCYLECACRAFHAYREKHIPSDIYLDTMRCFPRFLQECEKATGRLAFDRGWWTFRQTSLSIFRLGALEYEFCAHEGKNALSIHIPSDADLSPAAVDRSLEQAQAFFSRYFPEYRAKAYVCNSWLLSPRLRPFLSPSSRIQSFQNRFRVLRENPEDTEFIQWLFQLPEDTPFHLLPQDTSLQRQVRDLLLKGGAVGAVYAVLTR